MKKKFSTVYYILGVLQAVLSMLLTIFLSFLPFGKIGEVDIPNLLDLVFRNDILNYLFLPLFICILCIHLTRYELFRPWLNFGKDTDSFKKYYSKKYLVVELIFNVAIMIITLLILDYTIRYLGAENKLFYVLIIVETIISCGISIAKQYLTYRILTDDGDLLLEVNKEEYDSNVKTANTQKRKSILTVIISTICVCLISSQLFPSLSLGYRPFQFYNVNFINVYDADFEADSKFLSSLKFYGNDDYDVEEGVHEIEYYSNNMAYIDSVIEKLYKDLDGVNSFEEGLLISKQIDNLKNIKENLTYGYIYIKYKIEKEPPHYEFGGNKIGYLHSSILELKYDTKMNDGVDVKWGVKNGLNSLFCKEEIIMDTEFIAGTDFSNPIPIKVKYTDGSVRLSYVVASNYKELNDVTSGVCKFIWEDEWGNYEKEIKII